MGKIYVRLNPESSVTMIWDETQANEESKTIDPKQVKQVEENGKITRAIRNGALLKVDENEFKNLKEEGYTIFVEEKEKKVKPSEEKKTEEKK